MNSNPDDIAFLRNCRKKDPKAQQLLYDRYADRMFRVAFRYVRREPDAEDILIISFQKIFAKLTNFNYQGEGSLEAWIRKIIVNESLMWLRRSHNFNLTENIDDSSPEPDLSDLSASNAEDIYKMISALPVGYRTVFNLSVIEGFEHAEIAQLLGINEGTSRSQLFKAKVILKKMLTREGFHYGT